MNQIYKQNGFIAITTAMILSVILLLVATTLGFTSFFTRYNILDSEYKKISYSLAEGCIQESLLRLSLDNEYTTSNENILINGQPCKINSISPSSPNIIIKTSSDYKNYFTYLVVKIKEEDLSIASWEEVASP